MSLSLQEKFLGIIEPTYFPVYSPGMSRLGENLRKLREAKGFTQEQVAVGIGHTKPSSISAWENWQPGPPRKGKRISHANLRKLAAFFSVTPQYIDQEGEVWNPEAPRNKTVAHQTIGDVESNPQAQTEQDVVARIGVGAMAGRSREDVEAALLRVVRLLPRPALEDLTGHAMDLWQGRRRKGAPVAKKRGA